MTRTAGPPDVTLFFLMTLAALVFLEGNLASRQANAVQSVPLINLDRVSGGRFVSASQPSFIAAQTISMKG